MKIQKKSPTGAPAISAALATVLLAASSLTTADPISYSFQNGADTYTGNRDVKLLKSSADSNRGGSDEIEVDEDSLKQALVAFDDIIGASANQIAPNATIVSATYTVDITSSGDALELYLMTTDWDEDSVTFNSFGGGVSTGSQTVSTPFETTDSIVAEGTYNFDVTAAVQAWANGTTNNGFAVLPTGEDGVDWRSSEYGTVSSRPKLTVVVAAPSNVVPAAIPTLPLWGLAVMGLLLAGLAKMRRQ